MTRRSLACGAALLIAAAALAGCGRKQTQAPATANQAPLPTARVDEARLLSSEAGGDMWLTTGGDFGKTHYSRLTDISRDNVARLGFAWEYQTNTNRGLEATPIVVDGVMYTSGIAGRVYALDARTGREIWTFQPNVDMQVNRSGCCDMVNRGVAVWHGKVYVAALDGWLYALDATDGTEAWRADTFADRGRGYTSTGAPQIAGDVVVIGNGGAEFDARGYVSAYDLESGIMRWRFFTVPGDPKNPPESPALVAAAKTWDANSNWDVGGGGTVWDALVYDPKLKLLYVGVGNGAPWAQQFRSPQGGDNLYLASILALDPADGTLVWHYQEVPGEQWDYTATQPMLLTDVEVNGTTVPVVMHAPKNGFAYVIDRRNGKVLAASKFARVNWATHVDLKTGRPAMDANAADYRKGPRIVFPSSVGAHNWNPMAWDPEQKVLYIPSADIGNLLFMPEHTPTRHAKGLNTGVNVVFADSVPGMLPDLPPDMQKQIRALPEMKNPGDLQPRGYLQAFDPITGKQRWAVPTSGWWDRGGVLATAGGLVFQGSDTGSFNIYDAKDGKLLKSIETGTSILAAPMTYRIAGVQYVAVMAAWGGGGWSNPHPTSAQVRYGNAGRILAFRLDGAATPVPPPLPPPGPVPAPPAQVGDAAAIERGANVFGVNCAICHANVPGSLAPDLRRMQAGTHSAFMSIVLDGALKARGMPQWSESLSREDATAIHAFLIDQQRLAHEGEATAPTQDGGKPRPDVPPAR